MKTRVFTILAVVTVLWIAQSAMATPVDSNSIIKDGIEYYMQTDKSTYNLGENVEMLYRVTNLSAEDVTFHFDDQYQYHFEIMDNGTVIWFTPKVGEPGGSEFVLGPNGYKEYAETWNMMNDNGTPFLPGDDFLVDLGSYVITGSLHPVFLSQQDKDRYVPVSVSIEIIPEPCSIALLGTGLVGLLAYGRKKK